MGSPSAVREALAALAAGTSESELPGFTTVGLARVRAALIRDLEGSDGGAAIDGLLRLCVVLRDRRVAPAAAEALAKIMRTVPQARQLLSRSAAPVRAVDKVRGFVRGEGREVHVRAPRPTDLRPDGTLSSTRFIVRDQRRPPYEVASRRVSSTGAAFAADGRGLV